MLYIQIYFMYIYYTMLYREVASSKQSLGKRRRDVDYQGSFLTGSVGSTPIANYVSFNL